MSGILGPGGEQKQRLGPGGTQQVFDFTISNTVLMIGGQILILVLMLMIVFFGVPPLKFPVAAVKNMVTKNVSR